MKPERWQQVDKLYHAAVERHADERAHFLDQACAGDEALRREVESLLAYHTRAEEFIESPALQIAANILANEQAQSAVGRTIGSYQVTSVLGAGGMGEVYLAEDTRLGRKVALKLLPKEFTQDVQRIRRFEKESRTASALNHPNIITIFDIGQADGTRYIATEFIEGQTLRQRMMHTHMTLRQILDVAVQVASALAAAHEVGIVHRDIKPENIMLRRDGYIKVLDFGLAKLITPHAQKIDTRAATGVEVNTETGVVLGTVSYMSPEQARGQHFDARSDLFSLGVVMYEMIAGRAPFAGESSADVIAAILDKEPPSLARFTPEIPEALEWIITKALRKDCAERYQTARELLTDLKSLKQKLEFEEELERSINSGQVRPGSVQDSARLSAVGTSPKPWLRSQGVRVAMALGAAAGLMALWLLVLRPGSQTKEAPTPLKNATFTQLTSQPGREYFSGLSPDGKSLIYVSRASGNWDIYLQRVGGSNPTNLTKDSSDDDTQPAFSPDGERIAFRSERDGGGIYVMGATGESVIRVSDSGYNPAWSPDGGEIVLAEERTTQPSARPATSQLWTINIKGGERRLITKGDALQPGWSPQGHRIAYWRRAREAGEGEDIWTIPAGGGEAVAVTKDFATDWNPVWSPDGRYIYFSSNRGGSTNIWRVAIDEKSGVVLGEPEAVTTIGAATSAQHLSFSRDGRRLAYVALEEIRNLKKVTFDPSTGKAVGEPVSITRGSMQLWFPDLSPDDEWLTCYSMGQQRHIFIMRKDGSGLRDLTDDIYRNQWPRWSPDGKRIAFSSRRTGINELWIINRDGSGLQQLTQNSGAHYSPWSPDGTKIAYSTHIPENDCVIFQPAKPLSEQTPEHLTPLSDPSISFEGWSFSPDGKKLAGIRHLPSGAHLGIGVYDLESQKYDWLTDFGDWPLWLNDNRRLLFVNQGKILLFDTKTRKYQPVLSVTDEDVDIGSPGLSRDNSVIYFSYVAAEADIWLLTLE